MAVLALVPLCGCSAQPPAAGGPSPSVDDTVLAQTFDGLGSGPFDAAGRLTGDGRRVQDVLALQGALLRFRAARAAYPELLDELVPEFSASVPHDPVTSGPYEYHRSAAGSDYSLTATLSNGRVFAGVPHDAQ